MPFDGATLYTIAHELRETLVSGRIDKIHQISKDQLRVSIRTKNGAKKLLMSVAADSARVHLTNTTATNPVSPPMFCMLLRKHLSGGIITDIKQYELERILEIIISSRDELGREAEYIFRHEIMGKHSNIVLSKDNIIIDSIKRIDEEKSRVRQILPNYEYEYPPKQDKLDPMMMDRSAFHHLLLSNNGKGCAKALSNNILGLSVQSARYFGLGDIDMNMTVANISGAQTSHLVDTVSDFYKNLKSRELNYYLIVDPDTDEIRDFMMMHIQPMSDECIKIYEDPNMLVDEYYSKRELRSQLKQQTSSLMQSLSIILKRTRRNLIKQQDILNDTANADKFRLYGELLTAYQSQVPKGAKEVSLVNYYSENSEMVNIPLDPEKTPNVNAQKYYKKYQKLSRAMKYTQNQIEETKAELDYLESMEHTILNCDDLNAAREIQQEFRAQGYVKKHLKKDKKDRRKFQASKPRHYVSKDGHDIYVGRNNKQNDQLTMKTAKQDDMWLHTQKIAGSHVVIKAIDGKISKQALSEGVLLAAYYSKGQSSSNVPVDYTLRKNIKKPNGAKPGYVIYSTHSTMTATPKLSLIKDIKELE